MARLLDVARAAGVSRSTASNVFNRPELVRPQVRERVAAAADALGYAGPDPKGRLLRAGTVHAIGIVPFGAFTIADTLDNPLHRLFMRGVAEVCDQMGASLNIIPGIADQRGGGLKNALVDGFILSRLEDLAHIEVAKLRRLPFVVLDTDAGSDISSVRVDARAGCRAAANHLLDLGHRRFAIMSFLRDMGPARRHPPGGPRGPDIAGMQIDQEKMAGYREALAAAGIRLEDVPIVQARPWDTDAPAMLLDLAPEATGFLSMSDQQGIGIMQEARRRGRLTPRDLSVVGFNNIPEAGQSDPALTTVDGRAADKGRIAARIVFAPPGPPRQEVLPATLLLRASTGPARAEESRIQPEG